jgi:hypothetical protein
MSTSYTPMWIEARQHWIIPVGGDRGGNMVQPSMVNIVFPVIQHKRKLYLKSTVESVEMATYQTDKGNEIMIYVYEDTIVIRHKQSGDMRLEYYAHTPEDMKKALIKNCLDVLRTNTGVSQDSLQRALHEKLEAIEHYFDNDSFYNYPPYKSLQEQQHRAFLQEQERRHQHVRLYADRYYHEMMSGNENRHLRSEIFKNGTQHS